LLYLASLRLLAKKPELLRPGQTVSNVSAETLRIIHCRSQDIDTYDAMNEVHDYVSGVWLVGKILM
jgi:hypothetical protein